MSSSHHSKGLLIAENAGWLRRLNPDQTVPRQLRTRREPPQRRPSL